MYAPVFITLLQENYIWLIWGMPGFTQKEHK